MVAWRVGCRRRRADFIIDVVRLRSVVDKWWGHMLIDEILFATAKPRPAKVSL